MSATFTITCPKCGSTTTVTTATARGGSGVGSCQMCHKSIRIYVDEKGNIKKVE